MADSPGLVDRLYVEIGANTAPLMTELRAAREHTRSAVQAITRETNRVAVGAAVGQARAAIGSQAGGVGLGNQAAMAGGLLGQNVAFGNVLRVGAAIQIVKTTFDAASDFIDAFNGDMDALRRGLNTVTFGVWGAGEKFGMRISGKQREIDRLNEQFAQREAFVKEAAIVSNAQVKFRQFVEDEEANARIASLRGDEARIAEIDNQLRKELEKVDQMHAQMVSLFMASGRDIGIVDELASRARAAIEAQASAERSAINSAVSIDNARVSVPGQFSREPLIPELLKQIARHTQKEPPRYFFSGEAVKLAQAGGV